MSEHETHSYEIIVKLYHDRRRPPAVIETLRGTITCPPNLRPMAAERALHDAATVVAGKRRSR